jgi:hypothetical protein
MDMLDGKDIPFDIETIITSPFFLSRVKGFLKEK